MTAYLCGYRRSTVMFLDDYRDLAAMGASTGRAVPANRWVGELIEAERQDAMDAAAPG